MLQFVHLGFPSWISCTACELRSILLFPLLFLLTDPMHYRSRYQLTYQQAQDLLDGKSPMTGPRDMAINPRDHAELRSRLQMLDKLTNKLRAARVQVSK